ncbi:MAG: hypothetical protein Q8L14_37415 [Myxococcales bacterium]|nr:hypothetical protein [Myxococcales bacterium]
MNQQEARLGARVLVLGGLPVCGAIVTSFMMFAFRALTGGPPLEDRDWVAGFIFVFFAALGLLISSRAAWRVWKGGSSVGEEAPLLARISPLLVVGGLVAGVFIGRAIERSAEGSLERGVAFFWCEDPTMLGFSDVAACVAAGTPCLHEGWVSAEKWQGKADELVEALKARRAAAMAAPEYDDQLVRKLDGMLGELAVREGSVNRSAARRAGVACLHAGSPKR